MLSFILDLGVGEPAGIDRGRRGRRGSSVAAGAGLLEVLLPGEPERSARERRRAEGVPIDDLADVRAAIASPFKLSDLDHLVLTR